MAEIVDLDAARVQSIIARHEPMQRSLLPIFHDIQHALGYVPDRAVPLIAKALNLSRAEVHGVLTFYHDFRHAPAGRHILKLCQAEACQAMGCRSLAEHVTDRAGVKLGGTTLDGRLTVEAVYCLGLCATAPSALLDGQPLGRVTPAKLDAALGALA